MVILKKITPKLKSKLNLLLENCERFDIAIDSILEGQTGGNISITLDDRENPKFVQIIQGTFIIYAGDYKCDLAKKLISNIPSKYAIQPTREEWISLAKKIHNEKLISMKRFKFSGKDLNKNTFIC